MGDLKELLTTLVYLADFSLDVQLENPIVSEFWNKIAENCVHDGKGYFMDVSDQNELYNIFKIPYLSKEPVYATEVLEIIVKYIIKKYENGLCARYMIKGDSIITNTIYDEPTEDLKPELFQNKFKRNKSTEHIRNQERVFEQSTKTRPEIDTLQEKSVIIVSPKSSWCCC
jgi:hypothetical protein